jgi:Mrp family chromosome partitioning ATPase
MRQFLREQRQAYDTVIIDGPPALIVTDARILAGLADGTLIVVRADRTARGVVQRLIRELRSSQIRILGVLLNDVRPRRGGYFQQTYQSYYEYIAPAELAAAEDAGVRPGEMAARS